jgi:UDP-2-acetamido-2,6-beta-L-arabino-hexul-4-ose reductase
MTSILLTGSTGFVGRNLINRIISSGDHQLFILDREFKLIFPYKPKKIDWVIHLASMHRSKIDSQVLDTNIQINKSLISFLENNELYSNILFTSSVKEEDNTFYGRSKKEGAYYLKENTNKWDKSFVKIVLPNLFGPFARPYHTSVVANFCKDIIDGKKSFINDVDINLLYVQDAAKFILNFENQNSIKTKSIFLPELYKILENLYNNLNKESGQILINNKFEAQLLTTLMSYI